MNFTPIDGVSYRVTVDVSYGIDVKTMTFDSNDGTTLASWVDQTLAALTPCLPPE